MPWRRRFDWNVVNYAPLTVGGAFMHLRRDWYSLSAKKWFKDPFARARTKSWSGSRPASRPRVAAGPGGLEPF